MSDVNLPILKAIKTARASGFDVLESDGTTLLLDIDTEADYTWLTEAIALLNSALPNIEAKISKEWRSKSGNRHVCVSLGCELSITERLLLQAVCGSDRKRELLAYARVRKGYTDNNVSILFRPAMAEGGAA